MPDGGRSLFLGRVRDVIARAPVVCQPPTSALEIARLLSDQGVGSVVVLGPDGIPIGIVTDRDLRRKVVAEGRDAATTRAADIMSSPLVSIRPEAFAFEAILAMTRQGIRHLVVSDEGRLTGVVSIYDFVSSENLHPVLLTREIGRATSLDALATLSPRITDLTRRLLAEGGTAYDVGQIVSQLNDRVVGRVLALAAATLAEAGMEAPGVSYCWLSFGSEARREQTLRTDQDNGLVFDDPPLEVATQAGTYYGRLGEVAVGGLVRVGVPPVSGWDHGLEPALVPAPVGVARLLPWLDHQSDHRPGSRLHPF